MTVNDDPGMALSGEAIVEVDGTPADEDAVLMQAVFGLTDPLTSMSPVHIPRGFTKSYIAGDVVEDLGARIRLAARDFVDHDAKCPGQLGDFVVANRVREPVR